MLDRFKNVEVSEKLEPESCPLDSLFDYFEVLGDVERMLKKQPLKK